MSLPLLVACGTDSPANSAGDMADSAGVEVVLSPTDGAWTDRQAQNIRVFDSSVRAREKTLISLSGAALEC